MAGKPKVDNPRPEATRPVRGSGRLKSPARPKSPSRKSPTRTKSPGRPKSTSTTSPVKTQEVKLRPATPTRTVTRNKSPGRPRAESPKRSTVSKSPSRRSPIRRSPGRFKEMIVELEVTKAKELKTVAQPTTANDSESDTESEEMVVEVKEKPKAAVRGRTRLIDVDTEFEKEPIFRKESSTDIKELTSFGLTRRSTRLTQQNNEVTTTKVYHLRQFDPITTKRIGEFSDEDELQEKESVKDFDYSGQKKYIEFGGSVGAAINMILLPLSAVALYMVCDENQCSFSKLPNWKDYSSISIFWDNLSVLVTISFLLILTILSAAPFVGRKVPEMPNKHSKYVYIMNGLFNVGVALITVCVLEFQNVRVADFIVDHIFHLLISSIILSVIISIVLYFRSYYVPISALNTHVAGKSSIYGFFMGRELNPRIFGNIDLKIILFRAFLIEGILIDFAYLYKSLGVDIQRMNDLSSKAVIMNPTIVVFVILHSIYLIDPLICESTWTTTFTQQQEGLGYQLVMIFSTATFFHAALIRYLYEYEIELETWKLVLAGIIFAFGYILSRGSDNEKAAFRRNPYGPNFSNCETIPTSTGKKLFASGFWGIVRHPNYLGSIHVNLSWAIFCWNSPAVIGVILAILGLIGRTYRMEARCKLKYGAAWDRYCAKVKYALIPKIY